MPPRNTVLSFKARCLLCLVVFVLGALVLQAEWFESEGPLHFFIGWIASAIWSKGE